MNLSDPKIRRVIMAEMGRSGGNRRAQNLSPDARKEIAKIAANTRWSAWREARRSTPEISDTPTPCRSVSVPGIVGPDCNEAGANLTRQLSP